MHIQLVGETGKSPVPLSEDEILRCFRLWMRELIPKHQEALKRWPSQPLQPYVENCIFTFLMLKFQIRGRCKTIWGGNQKAAFQKRGSKSVQCFKNQTRGRQWDERKRSFEPATSSVDEVDSVMGQCAVYNRSSSFDRIYETREMVSF